ncbi:MAG: hypothetical protein AB2735_04590, partial [Candidatus Thiodiazotropha taylori]
PIPQTLKSPRATMETFLHAMNDIKRGDFRVCGIGAGVFSDCSVSALALLSSAHRGCEKRLSKSRNNRLGLFLKRMVLRRY